MPLRSQFSRQAACALTQPPQGRFWVTARDRLDQLRQGLRQLRIADRFAFPPTAFATDAQRHRPLRLGSSMRHFGKAFPNRVHRQASRLRYPTDAAPTMVLRFDCRPLPPHSFIHQRQQRKILGPNLFDGEYAFHTRHSIRRDKSVNLF